MKVLVDDEDLPIILQYKWYRNGNYVETKIKGKTVFLHRLIMNAQKGDIVDHLNNNTFDNRKSNLFITDVKGNSLNRKLNSNNRLGNRNLYLTEYGYRANMKIDGKSYNVGTYQSKDIASEIANFCYHLRREIER